MDPVIGIDLGTTNSAAAFLGPDGPQIIPNALGGRLTPSVVGVDESGAVLVGAAARELQVIRPERCASLFKRYMGTDRKLTAGGRPFTPEELSGVVLRTLKADAEAFFGHPVARAVITVPAYFNDRQRKATIAAGKIAGLDGRAHPQRADRRGHRLRVPRRRRGQEVAHLRPRRRHVRRIGGRAVRRHARGEGVERRERTGRRGLHPRAGVAPAGRGRGELRAGGSPHAETGVAPHSTVRAREVRAQPRRERDRARARQGWRIHGCRRRRGRHARATGSVGESDARADRASRQARRSATRG